MPQATLEVAWARLMDERSVRMSVLLCHNRGWSNCATRWVHYPQAPAIHCDASAFMYYQPGSVRSSPSDHTFRVCMPCRSTGLHRWSWPLHVGRLSWRKPTSSRESSRTPDVPDLGPGPSGISGGSGFPDDPHAGQDASSRLAHGQAPSEKLRICKARYHADLRFGGTCKTGPPIVPIGTHFQDMSSRCACSELKGSHHTWHVACQSEII